MHSGRVTGEVMGVKKMGPGFYGDDTHLFHVSPAGRVWLLCG
jgi:hypothetical protein